MAVVWLNPIKQATYTLTKSSHQCASQVTPKLLADDKAIRQWKHFAPDLIVGPAKPNPQLDLLQRPRFSLVTLLTLYKQLSRWVRLWCEGQRHVPFIIIYFCLHDAP